MTTNKLYFATSAQHYFCTTLRNCHLSTLLSEILMDKNLIMCSLQKYYIIREKSLPQLHRILGQYLFSGQDIDYIVQKSVSPYFFHI